MLYRKLIREIRGEFGSVVALILVQGLGIALFVGAFTGYRNLEHSLAETRSQLALPDLQVAVDAVTPDEVLNLKNDASITDVERRATAILPMQLERGRDPGGREGSVLIQVRAHSVPDREQPRLNQLFLHDGRLAGAGEVVLDRHLAEHHLLGAGDRVVLSGKGQRREMVVSGVASSAEYLWVARNRLDLMPSPGAFGIVWMTEEQLVGLVGDDAIHSQLQLQVSGDRQTAIAAVRNTLDEDRISDITAQESILGVELLQLDVDAFRNMAGFFPLLFLMVGAFITAALLARMVEGQRTVIGTLRALGVSRQRVFVHYLLFSLMIGSMGAVLGVGVGGVLGHGLTVAYARELGVPLVVSRIQWDVLLFGIGLGLGTALLAAVSSAWRASRLPPAQAMRAQPPVRLGMAAWLRTMRGPVPLTVRLAMRNLARRPFRSLGTSLGVAAALVLVLLNGEVLEGMRLAMHTQFELAQRYDLRADLVMPLPARSLEKRLQSSGAIEQVESILSMPTRLAGPNGYRDTFLQGLEPEGTLLRSVDFDGQVVMPSPGGVVISRNLAGELGLAVGDEVVLSQPDLERETAVRIDDLADVALGHSVVMQLADAQSAFGLVGWTNTVLVNAKPGQIGDARGAMQDLPGVMRMQDLLGFRDQLNRYMALAWTVLGVMMLFSVLLASAILYNTASMAILERKRELATLRTLGHSFGRIIAMVTVENGVMAVLGFLMGVPLSIVSIRYALTLYSSDMFAIPFVFSPMTVAMVGVGSLVVLFLAQAPALRRIASTSLAETVRSREG